MNKNKLVSFFELSTDSISQSSHQDLNGFRKQLEEEKLGHLYQPYTVKKKPVRMYRLIFFGFAGLFLGLGTMIYFKTLTWTCSLLFGNCSTIKTMIVGTCGSLSALAFGVGYSLRTEQEATYHHVSKAKQHLSRLYARKQIQYGIKRFFCFGNEYKRTLTLNQLYNEALHKIHEEKDVTIHLLDQIAESSSVDTRTREQLFNHAILELREKLALIVHAFHATPLTQSS